jgi:hypothetical protein
MHCCHVTFKNESLAEAFLADGACKRFDVFVLYPEMFLHAGHSGKVFQANFATSCVRLFMEMQVPIETANLRKALVAKFAGIGLDLAMGLFHVVIKAKFSSGLLTANAALKDCATFMVL